MWVIFLVSTSFIVLRQKLGVLYASGFKFCFLSLQLIYFKMLFNLTWWLNAPLKNVFTLLRSILPRLSWRICNATTQYNNILTFSRIQILDNIIAADQVWSYRLLPKMAVKTPYSINNISLCVQIKTSWKQSLVSVFLNQSKQCGFTCFDPDSSSRQQQQQITDSKVMSDPGEK